MLDFTLSYLNETNGNDETNLEFGRVIQKFDEPSLMTLQYVTFALKKQYSIQYD